MHARGWRSLGGWLLASALLAGCAGSPHSQAPGSSSRTLSAAEVDALLAGEGMGMAAPAEINGYPGPAHVLELKEELELTPDQRFATSRLVGLMRGQARALGQRIVDAERRLDEDLADGNITGAQVRARLETIGSLRAQLRYTHIDAHLEQKKILTTEQVARYYELRGRVVVRAPMLPPKPTEPLTLPVEAPAAVAEELAAPAVTPALPAAPAVLPTLPDAEPEAMPEEEAPVIEESKPLPVQEEPARESPVYPLTPFEETPTQPPALLQETAPVEEEPVETPEEVQKLSPGAQDAMEDAEPAREPPTYPLTPFEETPAQPPALLQETSPVEEELVEAPEEAPKLSPGAQDAMEDAEPAREPPTYPLTPFEETPAQPPALLQETSPVEEEPVEAPEEAPKLSPGAQDAMEDAEPVREPPTYPLTPFEETPAQPPALLQETSPVEEDSAEAAEETPKLSPGAQDAMEEAEPVREPPALPLTPIEENPTPPVSMPAEETPVPARDAPSVDQRTLSPGMQDAIEFAEPDSGAVEEPVHIAPLEDDLQELEPTDLREPVTIDLD